MLGKSSLALGVSVVWQESRLTYRVDGQVLIIVFYERVRQKNKGLRSGFKDIFDWLTMIKNEVPQINSVIGRVDPLSSAVAMSGLNLSKLNRFYQDIMQVPEAPDLGDKWYRYDISQLRDMRFHFANRHKSSQMKARKTKLIEH